MNKALMISIQPQHAVNILNGKKTLELRTWIPKGYVGWVYAYVTKGKPYLIRNENYGWQHKKRYSYFLVNEPTHYSNEDNLNGKVAFLFWFDEYDKYDGWHLYHYYDDYDYAQLHRVEFEKLVKDSCVGFDRLYAYSGAPHKDLYAWHIKKLEIFDTPKQLSEFKTVDISKYQDEYGNPAFDDYFELTKAPQRSVWVYV